MNWLVGMILVAVAAPPILSLVAHLAWRNAETWILVLIPAFVIGISIFLFRSTWLECGSTLTTNDLKCPYMRDLMAMIFAGFAICIGSGLAALSVTMMKRRSGAKK
jgi:hypothetical protein